MPITFVKEHVVDRIQREKKGWGKPAVVSRTWICTPALLAAEGLAGRGAGWRLPFALGDHPPRQSAGLRKEGEISERLTGWFPSARPLGRQTLVFEQAVEDLGCV